MNDSSALPTVLPRADAVDLDAIGGRGLFHDLEHGLTTVRYLVDAVRGDPTLSGDGARRLANAADELNRLCEVVDDWLSGHSIGSTTRPVLLREMAHQLATLSTAEHETPVTVEPGPEIAIVIAAPLVWRVLSNVVGNAVRAAGPTGHVSISVDYACGNVVVAVTDDGPGFGAVPAGRAGIGLRVVTSLLASCGGRLSTRDDRPGTTIQLVFPERLVVDVGQVVRTS